ncbi:Alpha crystallin/Hsp20 domain-containing protein [Canna indica]|uniref:Alpha crystallin/Hsp20 domain-containing protein n=1 Tax=Canna indica TaxID=4628 RepID=A0AAQ3JPA0_9LILI|nr:Alpha crystallin/Hsp20 domain-containing protein [Canna indica]
MSLIQNFMLGRHGYLIDAASHAFPFEDHSGAADIHIDWKETTETHVFKADLPGVRKEDVKVEVEDGRVLSITAERSRDEKEDCEWHCLERSCGRFSRRFQLPEDAKADEMKASMANGVLTLVVPKADVKKPKARSIEITSGGAGKKKGKETTETHVFKADLPGVRKEDVKVEVEDGRVLSITAERSRDEKEDCEWHCLERSCGRFSRRFQLPEDAKADEMKASMANGVLTLVVPKADVKKPKARSIEITSGGAGKKKGKLKDDGAVCCSFWPL